MQTRTTTDQADVERDAGGLSDGAEDTNANGRRDDAETHSNDAADDQYDRVVNDDCDGDGLTNDQEAALGTDPNNADSDNGRISDGAEVANKTHPRDARGEMAAEPTDVQSRGGSLFGCATSPTQNMSWIALIFGALFFFRRRPIISAAAFATAFATALALLLVAPTAQAQDRVAEFDVQQLNPMPLQTTNYYHVGSTRVLDHLGWGLDLFLHYADAPLVLRQNDGNREFEIVSGQSTLNIMGGFGLFGRFDLGIDIPIVLAQGGDALAIFPGTDAPDAGFGIGDIRVVPRVLLFSQESDEDPSGLSMALLVPINLPTGDGAVYQGGDFRIEPRVALDYAFSSSARLGLNLGYLIRENKELVNLEIGDALTWGLASDIALGNRDQWHIVPEINGELNVSADEGKAEELPTEFTLGGRYFITENLMAQLGGGVGLVGGYGSPDWRLFAGLSYSGGANPDPDGDGLVGSEDECPNDPEDFDNFEDTDGCSDPDNDGDGVRDTNDECPTDPEDQDGFEDNDGCADPDNDNDGVLDVDDQCPMVPEDVDTFEDTDGCVDEDNDQDGILDTDDACPLDPEDMDGYLDTDGCTDLDNDVDGVLDADDACMNEPEDYDGFEDEDGCPEEGEGVVRLSCDTIDLGDSVYFDTNSDVIQERSFELLNQVAAIMDTATYLRRIRVEGHTDSRGSDEYNLDLSDRRAASVVVYLIEAGIDAERLESQGLGEVRPIATNDTSDGRQDNRRVEFHVVERDGRCEE
jgi:outer membrane protein OmpA-like peptidoglycan-associated protein